MEDEELREEEEPQLVTVPACDIGCVVKLDTAQVIEVYDALSARVNEDLEKQYKSKQINGATWAASYTELMKQVIDGSLSAVVSLQGKETEMDRCVKQAQCDASKIKSENETCIAVSTCGKNNAEKDLIEAKELAEDIKNGIETGVGSLYAQNILTAKAQEALYVRQKTGFSDNARQKVLDSQLSAWSVAYNNLESWTLPSSVEHASIDAAVATVNNQMGTD